jgi:splicing suppressor protein 51
MEEMEFRFLTNSLSSPLTLLNGLTVAAEQARSKASLVFHVAGSDIIEMLGIIKWEYILHRLPAVKSLRIVFIGLQLAEEEDGECSGIGECSDCSEAERTMKYEIRKKTYKVIFSSLVCLSVISMLFKYVQLLLLHKIQSMYLTF